jgi:TM2 domain-containing membrane protein YozV
MPFEYESDPFDSRSYDDPRDAGERQIIVQRAPSPGIAAVLSVLLPGLGQVYCGRLLAGAVWFVATSFAYWAILVPGFVFHALCVWSAYQSARDWRPDR